MVTQGAVKLCVLCVGVCVCFFLWNERGKKEKMNDLIYFTIKRKYEKGCSIIIQTHLIFFKIKKREKLLRQNSNLFPLWSPKKNGEGGE